MSHIPAATSTLLWQRAGGRCELCGLSLASGPYSRHHRRPRRMGGTRRPDVHSLPNLLLLCGDGVRGCHGRVESDRAEALAEGWLLHDGEDPATTPVRIHPWGTVILTPDGCYATPEVVAP